MGLLVCEDCGGPVSAKAAGCPHCGCPRGDSGAEPDRAPRPRHGEEPRARRRDAPRGGAARTDPTAAALGAVGCVAVVAVAAMVGYVASGRAAHEGPGIGVAYEAVMQAMGIAFTRMETTHPDDGLGPCYAGRSSDGLSLLSLRGEKADLAAAEVVIGTPADSPAARERGVVLALAFLRKMDPTWTEHERPEWFRRATRYLGQHPDKTVVTDRPRARVSAEVVPGLGWRLRAEPRGD